jgi:hypothetical protein
MSKPSNLSPVDTDPVFEAIEKHRAAEAILAKARELTAENKREAIGLTEEEAEGIYDPVWNAAQDARDELVAAVPQTKAGMRAKLVHLSEYYSELVCEGGYAVQEHEWNALRESINASPALA